jgi:hypothetical protein
MRCRCHSRARASLRNRHGFELRGHPATESPLCRNPARLVYLICLPYTRAREVFLNSAQPSRCCFGATHLVGELPRSNGQTTAWPSAPSRALRARKRVNAAPSASCCDRVVAKLTPYLRASRPPPRTGNHSNEIGDGAAEAISHTSTGVLPGCAGNRMLWVVIPEIPLTAYKPALMIKLAERCDDCALARKPGGPVHG